MLTPLDIHNKEFRKGFRGYDEQEVDAFLDEVVRDFEAVLKERDQMRDSITDLRRQIDQYRLIEDSLQKALVVAQQAAEEVTAASGKEAELIIEKARQEGERSRQEILERIRDLEDKAARTRSEMDLYRAKMRTLLESQLEILDQMKGVGDAYAATGEA